MDLGEEFGSDNYGVIKKGEAEFENVISADDHIAAFAALAKDLEEATKKHPDRDTFLLYLGTLTRDGDLVQAFDVPTMTRNACNNVNCVSLLQGAYILLKMFIDGEVAANGGDKNSIPDSYHAAADFLGHEISLIARETIKERKANEHKNN